MRTKVLSPAPLVVKVNAATDESLMSLIVRSCGANFIERPAHLLEMAGGSVTVPAFAPFTDGLDVDGLSSLLRLPLDEVHRRTHITFLEGGSPWVDWYGVPLERVFLEARVRRTSAAADEQPAYHRDAWQLRALPFCAVSRTRLIDFCTSCGGRLGWTKCHDLTRCDNCTAVLTAADIPAIDECHWPNLLLGAAIVDLDPKVRTDAIAALPPPFDAWSSNALLRAFVDLGGTMTEEVPTLVASSRSSSPPQNYSAEHFAYGVRFVLDWDRHLAAHVGRGWRARGSTSATACLGSLAKYLDIAKHPLNALLKATYAEAMVAASVPVRLSQAHGTAAARQTNVTAEEALELFGMRSPQIRRLEGKSKTFVARGPGKGGQSLYNRAALEQLLNRLNQVMTEEAVADRLGIPKSSLSRLNEIGLKFVRDEDSVLFLGQERLVLKTSLEELESSLALASTLQLNDGLVSLASAMLLHRGPFHWCRVFSAIMSGEIDASICPGKQPFAEQIFVERQSIADLFGSLGVYEELEETLSCLQAATIVGSSDIFVAQAVKLGLIEGVRGVRNSAIKSNSAVEFAKTYILPREMSQRLGVSLLKVRGVLNANGVPVARTVAKVGIVDRQNFDAVFPNNSGD